MIAAALFAVLGMGAVIVTEGGCGMDMTGWFGRLRGIGLVIVVSIMRCGCRGRRRGMGAVIMRLGSGRGRMVMRRDCRSGMVVVRCLWGGRWL